MRSRHLTLVMTALMFSACDSDSTGPDIDPGPEPVGVVDDGGGTVETSDGAVKLSFPEGAVSGDTEITVEEAETVPEDPGLVPGTTYDFGPDGAVFAEPVDIVLRYDPARLPAGIDESSLALHKAEGDAWRKVGASVVDTEARTVTATLTSFSVYGLLSLGAAAAAEVEAGEGQAAPAGQPVGVAPAVLVLNERGDPLPDVDVAFTVAAGSGTVSGGSVTTDESGVAAVGSWTLGDAAGEQTLSATVEGLDPVIFTATAVAPCQYSAPYLLGETVEGTLGAPDCVDGAGRYADYHHLETDEPIEIGLTMTAEGFDPVVGVYAVDGAYLVAQYASSRGFTRALLGSGTYRVGTRRMDPEGSTLDPNEPAPYTLTVQEMTHTAESCDIANTVFVTPGVTATGTIGTGHCTDEYSDDPEARYAQYQMHMRVGFEYTMTLVADTAAGISVWGADGLHKDYAHTSVPGTVRITYTPEQDGFHGVPVLGHAGVGYELQFEVSEAPVDRCEQSTPYTVGATNRGTLTAQSCVDGQGRYTEYYDLVVEDQLSVTLEMGSGDFEPYISAFDADDRLVVTQYVASPGFTRGVFAPGTYRLAARSAGEALPGGYEFSLQEDDHFVDVCDAASHVFVTPGVVVDGYITDGDCLDELAEEPGLYWENYPVRLMPGESLTANLSAGAHARLSVWDPNGNNVALEMGEAASATNVSATITADVEGWYSFYAIAYHGTEYSLTFGERGLPAGAAPSAGPVAAPGMHPFE